MRISLRSDRQMQIRTDYEEKDRIKSQVENYRWDKKRNVWIVPLAQFRNIDTREEDSVSEDVKKKYRERYENDVDEVDTSLLSDDIELYDFQKPLARDLASKNGFLSALDMGLGKTAISVTAALHKMSQDNAENILVVAPASLRYQWAEEIHKFTGESVSDSVIIKGSNYHRVKRDTGERVNIPVESFEKIYSESPANFYITSYTTLSRESVELDQYHFDVMIADEASKLKSHDSKRTKMAKSIVADNKWALSGTPIEKSVKDLYNIIDFIDSGYLGRYKSFKQTYLVTEQKQYGRKRVEKVVGHKNLEMLKHEIDPIIHRRNKADVLDDLPDLTVTKRTVSMGRDQERVHAQLSDLLKERVQKNQSAGGITTYLQMNCNSTELLNKNEKFSLKAEEYGVSEYLPLEEETPKMKVLKDIKNTADKEDRKILAFTTHKDFAESIADEFDTKFLTGDHSESFREKVIKTEKNKDGHSMIVMTDILSYGANLQEFDIIVNIDLPWTAAKLSQRIDRIRRIGREDPVTCVNIVTEDSFEEKIDEVVQNRQKLFDSFFEEDSEITSQETRKMVEEVVRRMEA